MSNDYQAVLLTQAAWGDFGRTDSERFGEVTAALNWLALQTAQAKKGRRVVLRAEIVKIETKETEA
jgi:hypothetical protein